MSNPYAPAIDLTQVSAEVVTLIEQLRHKVESQGREIAVRDQEIALRDARLEKVNFELARLKRWKFGAKSEAMNAQQRALFQETLFEDEASLQAQLSALQADIAVGPGKALNATRAAMRDEDKERR